jgi:hypothetical protein
MQVHASPASPARQRQVIVPYMHPAKPPVPAVQLLPAVGSVVGQAGGGVTQFHMSIPPKPRHVQVVPP